MQNAKIQPCAVEMPAENRAPFTEAPGRNALFRSVLHCRKGGLCPRRMQAHRASEDSLGIERRALAAGSAPSIILAATFGSKLECI